MAGYQRRNVGTTLLDSSGHVAQSNMPLDAQGAALLRRTGALAETFTRRGSSAAPGGALTSGQMTLCAIPLLKGTVVSKITFVAGATAVATATNQWFALYSSVLALLGVTNDDTTNAWVANQEKQLTLATPYTVTADALFYLGIMVAASTVPTLTVVEMGGGIANNAPIICSRDATHTGLTTPATAPSTAILGSNLTVQPYAYVS